MTDYSMITDYLDLSDWRIQENSNMGFSLQGLNNHIVQEMTKRYWLEKIYSQDITEAHKSGSIHIHDLGSLSVYCCFTGDTEVSLVNGEVHTLKYLAENYFKDRFKVYSCTPEGEIVQTEAHSPRKVKTVNSLIRITLDNKKEIRCTEDHLFMMRDGSYKQAKDLQEKDSLMPLYRWVHDYSVIRDNLTGKTFYEHRYFNRNKISRFTVVHHKNGNKLDNRLENLEVLDDRVHRVLEGKKFSSTEEFKTRSKENMIRINKSDWKKQQVSSFAKTRTDLVRSSKGQFEYRNHKVKSVERIDTPNTDVYDLTVPKYHNFALSAGIFVHNCGWDLYDLLVGGFSGVDNKPESKPPKHLRSALAQSWNFMYTLQGESSGAQAFSNFDTLLAPFIAYDKLSYKEVKQSIQEFVYNMNVPTRVGFQCPFSNITLDLVCPKHLQNEPVIIGGEAQEQTYKEFQKEMDMLNKAFCEVMMEGDKKAGIFTFPIPTYNLTKDFDWNSPIVKHIFEMTGKYGIPYFANYINSDMKPEDSRSMCCFTGDTEVRWRSKKGESITTLRSLVETHEGDQIEVPFNCSWVTAVPIRVPYGRQVYEIELRNGLKYRVSDNHLHLTDDGIKTTLELQKGDYLPYSKRLQSSNSSLGSYDLGRFLGLYLAEGSSCGKTAIQFSISDTELDTRDFLLEYSSKYLGANGSVSRNSGKSLSVFIQGLQVRDLIKKFIAGKARTKRLLRWYELSEECLQGLWDGWAQGDGTYNSNDRTQVSEIYTSSKVLANQMIQVSYRLGIRTSLRERFETSVVDNREYRGMFYTVYICNTETGRIYKNIDNNYLWSEVISIEMRNTHASVYCLEVQTEDNLFELADGLVTHNCRLRLNTSELRKGGVFSSNPKTGSIGVVTINLPHLMYRFKKHFPPEKILELFYMELEHYLYLARESLRIKRSRLEYFVENNLYPYSKFYLKDVKERTGKYYTNHFSTIGIIGMHELLLNYGLEKGIQSEEGKKIATDVLNFIREKLREFQDQDKSLYNLEATPAEGASYRLAKLDKKRWAGIITSGEDEPYYTNSTQLPVDATENIFEALDHQDSLQTLYTGGTVLHGFLGEKISNVETCKEVVKKIAENYKLPYFTITPTFSICPNHGYLKGEVRECPECKSLCNIYSRVVGYFRPVQQWNVGKIEEYKDRVEFKENEF